MARQLEDSSTKVKAKEHEPSPFQPVLDVAVITSVNTHQSRLVMKWLAKEAMKPEPKSAGPSWKLIADKIGIDLFAFMHRGRILRQLPIEKPSLDPALLATQWG